MKSYFAPGKVMLTGEYLVLNGFDSFALPTHFGQSMQVWDFNTPGAQNDFLLFVAKDFEGHTWLQCRIELPTIKILEFDESQSIEVDRIQKILQKADLSAWKIGQSYRIETTLQFNKLHGLGSSSTLISLMAQFLKLDPLELQFEIFGGSGYDVAVAVAQKPIVYWLSATDSNWDFWSLNPELTENWEVVFLGKKMDSRKSIHSIQDKLNEIAEDEFYTAQFDHILQLTKQAKDISSLEASLEMYQKLLSDSTELETPYQTLNITPINKGLCKWLGAWGGDMMLVNKTILDTYPEAFQGMERILWNKLIVAN